MSFVVLGERDGVRFTTYRWHGCCLYKMTGMSVLNDLLAGLDVSRACGSDECEMSDVEESCVLTQVPPRRPNRLNCLHGLLTRPKPALTAVRVRPPLGTTPRP